MPEELIADIRNKEIRVRERIKGNEGEIM